jgi:hypothetical protein
MPAWLDGLERVQNTEPGSLYGDFVGRITH